MLHCVVNLHVLNGRLMFTSLQGWDGTEKVGLKAGPLGLGATATHGGTRSVAQRWRRRRVSRSRSQASASYSSLTTACAPYRPLKRDPRLPRAVSHARQAYAFPPTDCADACLRLSATIYAGGASRIAPDRAGCRRRRPPAAPPCRQPPAATAASGGGSARRRSGFAPLPDQLRLFLHCLDLVGPAASAHPGADTRRCICGSGHCGAAFQRPCGAACAWLRAAYGRQL